VDDHFCDFAAVRLIRGHCRDELHAAEKIGAPYCAQNNSPSRDDLGLDIARPKARRIIGRKRRHETDRRSLGHAVREKLRKLRQPSLDCPTIQFDDLGVQ
jgi:hypothetical protein